MLRSSSNGGVSRRQAKIIQKLTLRQILQHSCDPVSRFRFRRTREANRFFANVVTVEFGEPAGAQPAACPTARSAKSVLYSVMALLDLKSLTDLIMPCRVREGVQDHPATLNTRSGRNSERFKTVVSLRVISVSLAVLSLF
jgi:hypothetical protein